MQSQGWDAEYDEDDGGIEFSGDEQQAQAYDAAFDECERKFGEPAVAFEDFTADQWRSLYNDEMDRAACLRRAGVEVPQAPTYESFVERYQTDDSWIAYRFVGNTSESQWRKLNNACPQ